MTIFRCAFCGHEMPLPWGECGNCRRFNPEINIPDNRDLWEKVETRIDGHEDGLRVETLPPDFSKPVDIQAYFFNSFGACGCSDLEAMVAVVKELLEWIDQNCEIPPYDKLFNHEGVFYILVGILDRLGLCEHGTSIRASWLTEKGKSLLVALQSTPFSEIDTAEGEAYDGITY